MESLPIEIDTKALERAMRIFPVELKANFADAFDHASRKFFKTFYRTRLRGEPGVKATSHGLFHRFRRVVIINGKATFLNPNMGRSYTVAAIGKSDDVFNMQIDMYTKSKSASIHERGGEISTGGRYMKIPLRNVRIRSNVKLIALKLRGGLFLVRVNRRQRTVTPFYVLKNRVHMRARLGFYATWSGLSGRRTKILNDAIAKTIKDTKL